MYGSARRGGLGDVTATTLAPITNVAPSPLPAGPGQQIVTVYSSGLRETDNLTFFPVDPFAPLPLNVQHSAPIFDIAADGSSAKALIDFGGYVGDWKAQIISPYTNEQSPEFPVTTIAAPAAPFNFNLYALESGQLSPILAIALSHTVSAKNAQGQSTAYQVLDGAEASLPQVDGTTRDVRTAGPGLWVNQSGGTWKFIPAAQAVAAYEQRFGSLLSVSPDLTEDPFGLPILSPSKPAQLAWVDAAGNPVSSPWSTVAGPPIGTITAGAQQQAMYQSAGMSPSLAPLVPAATAVAPTVPPLYTSPATVPAAGPSAPAPSTSPDLYQSPMSNGPTDATPAPSSSAPASGFGTGAGIALGLLLLAAGLSGLKKTRGDRTWR